MWHRGRCWAAGVALGRSLLGGVLGTARAASLMAPPPPPLAAAAAAAGGAPGPAARGRKRRARSGHRAAQAKLQEQFDAVVAQLTGGGDLHAPAADSAAVTDAIATAAPSLQAMLEHMSGSGSGSGGASASAKPEGSSWQAPHRRGVGCPAGGSTDPSPMSPGGLQRGGTTPDASPNTASSTPTIIRTFSAEFAVNPKTGARHRFGPAMSGRSTRVELPALAALFADISSPRPVRPWNLNPATKAAPHRAGQPLARTTSAPGGSLVAQAWAGQTPDPQRRESSAVATQPPAGDPLPAVHGEQPGGAVSAGKPPGQPEMTPVQAAAGPPPASPAAGEAPQPARAEPQHTAAGGSSVPLPLGTPQQPPLPLPPSPAAAPDPGTAEPTAGVEAGSAAAAAAQAGKAAAGIDAEAGAPQSGAAKTKGRGRGRRPRGKTAAQLHLERKDPPKRGFGNIAGGVMRQVAQSMRQPPPAPRPQEVAESHQQGGQAASQLRGVSRRPWHASYAAHLPPAGADEAPHFLGCFRSQEAAAAAHDVAALYLRGPAAATNFPAAGFAAGMEELRGVAPDAVLAALRREAENPSALPSRFRGVFEAVGGGWEARCEEAAHV